ncbi:MAG TPA: hypothetical protein VG714_01455 [Acidobacteriaceae bacterium]|nr:hypothetical protein [Acidobacteriaceae bacterium]
MILEKTPDEAAAVGRFYELLDAFRARKEKPVALVKATSAEVFRIVTYTSDPGFFPNPTMNPTHAGPSIRPLNGRSVKNFEPLEILNVETWEWLLREDTL